MQGYFVFNKLEGAQDMFFLKLLNYVDVDIGNINDGSIRDNGNDNSQIVGGMNDLLSQYKELILGIYGTAIFVLIAIFLYRIIRLEGASNTPMTRQRILSELLVSILAITLLGAIGYIAALIYNLLR
ncbi:hypothetical protein [Coprococcus eutactus]|jgi:hypothetical protein|uniref:hypothetical protein n=1 Tax=Coprococcus eutactus TaxID=33043 RepID=UPI0032194E71